jgi:hypothetical protein
MPYIQGSIHAFRKMPVICSFPNKNCKLLKTLRAVQMLLLAKSCTGPTILVWILHKPHEFQEAFYLQNSRMLPIDNSNVYDGMCKRSYRHVAQVETLQSCGRAILRLESLVQLRQESKHSATNCKKKAFLVLFSDGNQVYAFLSSLTKIPLRRSSVRQT